MNQRSSNPKISTNIDLKDYVNINQFRNDIWHRLKETSNQFATNSKSNPDPKLKLEIRNILGLLILVEQYWVYPGSQAMANLSGMFKRKEFKSFSNMVADIVRALVSESYRSRTTGWVNGKGGSKSVERKLREDQHYFEVLFVDDVDGAEELSLKHNLIECRKTHDQFVYDIVLARTFQDSLITLLFNHNIQSCVIRYGFPVKSCSKLDAIRPSNVRHFYCCCFDL